MGCAVTTADYSVGLVLDLVGAGELALKYPLSPRAQPGFTTTAYQPRFTRLGSEGQRARNTYCTRLARGVTRAPGRRGTPSSFNQGPVGSVKRGGQAARSLSVASGTSGMMSAP